jgi:hypothetical protein
VGPGIQAGCWVGARCAPGESTLSPQKRVLPLRQNASLSSLAEPACLAWPETCSDLSSRYEEEWRAVSIICVCGGGGDGWVGE